MKLGTGEILLIVGVLVLLFGAKRIPELARSLRKAGKELKDGLDDEDDDEPAED